MDAKIQKAEGKLLGDDDLDFRSPFTAEILEALVSPKLPLPSIAPYDGTTDPADHVHGFESHMVFHGASDAAKCRSFPTTLKEAARAWFEALPAGSISSFHQLKKSFSDNFLVGRSQPRTAASLLSVRQKKDEALWDYVQWFRTEVLRIPSLDVSLATSSLIRGTRDGFLQRTLGVQQSPTLSELLSTAQRHAACEENLAAGRANQANSPRNGKDLIRSFEFSEEVSTSCLPSTEKPYREPDMTNGTTPGHELFSSEDQCGIRPMTELNLRGTHEPLDTSGTHLAYHQFSSRAHQSDLRPRLQALLSNTSPCRNQPATPLQA
ncbi:hypothetical protein Taro_049802 [Colocasia esculenta]|uniref:Retrotransposon gag domain-containing protein n=1 Tax=Colocasia esculenta TaxID=4460 RepID=A0A843XC23_COLES|nr:hypothetical protein [Colocasia esculenta]